MAREIVICPVMYPFDLPPSEGEEELDIVCILCIVCKFSGFVLVKLELLSLHSEFDEPFETFLFPVGEPFFVCTGADEELHFHLFKFSRPEKKILRIDFIPECLPDLRDTERHFLP